ncbi:MAG: ABC transporter substrate-binding protein [Clostridia bacterium]|nr:ABC transporter substrate-binding protein [Clostridia bacterium]
MKKLFCLLLMGILLVASAHALSFTDANGRSVEIENPQCVVSLYNSYGEAWMLAGGKLIGSIADGFENGMLDDGVQNLGSHTTPSMELLFSLNPDFVLLSSEIASHAEIAVLLEQAGIPCAFFSTPDYRSYMEMISVFAQLTGKEDLHRQQIEAVQQPIEEMIKEAEALPDPTVLLIRANSITVKCKNSETTVAGNILRDMGFVNLADGNSALCESISMETVLIEDPDYIFVVLQGASSEAAEKNLASVLTNNPAWNTLSAVREGRFYILDRDLFHYHPNGRWAESYEFILDVLSER